MIEMLVALAATLIMMGATVALFGVIADSVTGSRSLLEISDRLRACRNRLQADLQGATASMKPPLRPESDEGYLEIIEGPAFDGQSNIPTPTPPFNTLFGDCDDDLFLTVRSRGEPFVGKFNVTGTIESQVAEVLYFTAQDGPIIDATTSPPLRLFTLYRRVLLVTQGAGASFPSTADFYDRFDLSGRLDTTTMTMIPNTLGDLTKRENRFSHYGLNPTTPTFPFAVNLAVPPTPVGRPTSNASRVAMTGVRLGDDILMTNVLAFDVQVFDPGAPVFVSSGAAVEPRDQGYAGLLGGTPAAFGAYADLGYAPGFPITGTNPPLFNRINPNAKSGITGTTRVYDTWSLHYENDGLPENGAFGIDAYTNGLDDDGLNGVDDIGEADTLPPYSAPLRAIRVTIRVYEPSSQQVRQVTVVQDFLPE